MESLPGHNGTGPGRKTRADLGKVSSKQLFTEREKHPLSMLSASAQGPARPLRILVGKQYPTSSLRDLREKLRNNNDQALKDNPKTRPDLLTLIWVRTNCSLMYFPCAIQLNIGPHSWDCVFEVHCYRGVNNINVVGNEITMNPFKIGQPRPDFQPSAEKFTVANETANRFL